ncbi:MAG: hypothetical protein LRY71_07525 [Bacillaceae bacterium]|nr:hypothetical protein [Bacillaceae bacterium]
MAYLLASSFILHIITLYVLTILIQRINAKEKKPEQNYEQIKREIEDLMLSYTTEIKEENTKLVRMISKMRIPKNNHQEVANVTEKKRIVNPAEDEPSLQETDDFTPPKVVTIEDKFEQSSTAQILSLANQGLSPKEIAKKLNMGDGEVELLLKFHK